MTNHPAALIFLHIPKTAGTSLRLTIAQQYPVAATYEYYQSQSKPLLEELSHRQRAAIRLMSSHEPFGTHDKYLTPPVHYLTMLRQPSERLISQYYYDKRRARDQAANINSSLLHYMEGLTRINEDNLQVRLLSGQGEMGMVTDKSLEIARANLLAPSMTFGLVERYAESLLLMTRQFGWQNVRLTRKNVTQRPHVDAIDEATRHAIVEHQRYDLALYAEAATLFTRRLAQADITPLQLSKLYVAGWIGKTDYFRQRVRRLARRAYKKSRRFIFGTLRRALRRLRHLRHPNAE